MTEDRERAALAVASPGTETLERAVLQVLANTPTGHPPVIEPVDLAAAVEVYRQAGRHALEQQIASPWRQLYIEFPDWATAEQAAATHLAPLLHHAEELSALAGWWFMRKQPCWRIRLLSGPAAPELDTTIGDGLDKLVATGQIQRWWHGLYEPETAAFGGEPGIGIAHTLFIADSRAVLHLNLNGNDTTTTGLGRRELSVLLCAALMRAAGLEWYEQADVWHRVALERPLSDGVPADRITAMTGDLRQLLLADTTLRGPMLSGEGPLAAHTAWVEAFRSAGHQLGAAARSGTLDRGLRHLLSYHVIFAWNRLGLGARTQSALARAARAAILDLPHTLAAQAPSPRPTHTPRPRHPEDASRVSAKPQPAPPARFPLIHAAHFFCADLPTRLRDVHQFAASAHHTDIPEERISRACAAWNLAALIAADCAMPNLAAELCHRQFAIFRAAWPLSGRVAIAALQPLVNLTRLHARTGDPRAYTALTSLHHAVHHGGTSTIGDLPISFDQFTDTEADRSEISPWLRVVMREDGTRLLTTTAQWNRAAVHAAQFDDAPEQLREARQTLAIAHVLDRRTDDALTLIDTSITHGPEDRAIAAVLRTWACLATNQARPADIPRMLQTVDAALTATPHHAAAPRATAMFRIRLGLAALTIAAANTTTTADPDTTKLLAELSRHAEESGDALTARELLRHPSSSELAPTSRDILDNLVHRAGLGRSDALAPHISDLNTALEYAGSALADWPT